ncbi:MAG: 16S rRNA (cytidine(1402)-2'-O)-methyltransferase [Oscillospiraceae bacterium]|nr:16S rRNA (cytidine(1402)-2'-O)-methyltransferase [Oscillospiraceae bacterium]
MNIIMETKKGVLYLVATPIGNLSDISKRALDTLARVDFIAAEDTRVTRKLLSHYEIKKKIVSYYEHSRTESGSKIIESIISGESCALVSDAGTPGISDPGEDLVKLCVAHSIEVLVIPGPCAAVAALTLSGLGATRFTFESFLPAQKKKRLSRLDTLKSENRTMVFYEAPHRLMATLADMLKAFGDRSISISRELTKIYDETLRFTLSEAIAHFAQTTPRGEFVLVVEGYTNAPQCDEELTQNAIKMAIEFKNSGATLKDAIKRAADETGYSKNELYKVMIKKYG